MKQIIICLIILFAFPCVYTLLADNIITGAKIVEFKSGVAVALSLQCNGIAIGDVVSFSVGDEPSTTTLKITASSITCPLTGSVTFTEAGLYNIILERGTDPTKETQKQKAQQIVTKAIAPTTLISCTATNPTVNTSVSIQFTFEGMTVSKEDKVIFSLSTADNPSGDAFDVTFPLDGIVFPLGTMTKSVTFTKEGDYTVWIQRDADKIKQTDPKTILKIIKTPKSPDTFATPAPLNTSDSPQSVILTFTSEVEVGDVISFTVKDTLDSTAFNHTVQAGVSSSPLTTNKFAFTTAGLFNIYITAPQENAVKQNAKLVVYAKPIDKDIITKADVANAIAGKSVLIKLNYVANTLYDGDKITFSTSATDSISGTIRNMTLRNVNFSSTSHAQSISFYNAGTYSMWMKRGSGTPIKQDASSINVAINVEDFYWDDGSMINTISLVLLIGLFIF